MQGFELMLKAMGVDPQKMADEAMAKFGPELEKFKGSVVETIKTEVIQPMAEAFGQQLVELNGKAMSNLALRLDSIDQAIKTINPGYTPMAFDVDLSKVTNPNTPEGGAVDMAALDQGRLANQGSVEDQASLAGLDQVDVTSPETDEPATAVQEADPAAAHTEG